MRTEEMAEELAIRERNEAERRGIPRGTLGHYQKKALRKEAQEREKNRGR